MGVLSIFNTCMTYEPERIVIVTTDSVSAVTHNSFIAYGTIVDIGEWMVSQHGFCYSERSNPTIDNSFTIERNEIESPGSFNGSRTGLASNTRYYIRAFATDYYNGNTIYGSDLEFVTRNPSTPMVEIAAYEYDLTSNIVTIDGSVSDDGGSIVTAAGVCWSSNEDPGIYNNNYTIDGSGIGVFSCEIQLSNCETEYYIRPYATNTIGTAFGNTIEITTGMCSSHGPDTEPPTVPVHLQVLYTTSDTIRIHWKPSSDNVGVFGYKIYITYEHDQVFNVSDPDTSFINHFIASGLESAAEHYFTVSAFDAAGNESSHSQGIYVATYSESTL